MGADHTTGIRRVHLVKHVAHVNSEREVVAPVGTGATHHGAAAEERTTRASTSASTTAATGSARPPRIAGCAFGLRAKAEGLGEAQIQHEMGGSGTVVDGKNSLWSCRQVRPGIKRSQRSAPDIRIGRTLHGLRADSGRYKSRAIVKDRVAILIVGRSDIKRRTGAGNNERAQTEGIRQ